MSLNSVIDKSEDLVRAAGSLPSARAGAAALALALGRVVAAQGLPLEALLEVVRISYGGGASRALRAEILDEESAAPPRRVH